MKTVKKLLLALLIGLSTVPALGQSVQQSGTVTPGHPARWVTNGVIGDGGTQASGSLTGVGVTTSGAGICQNSAAITSAGWQRICLGATTASGGFISVQNFGTATAQPLTFSINGVSLTVPTGTGVLPNVVLPLVNLQPICASGTTGILAGCAGSTNTIPYWTSATAQSLIPVPVTAPFGGTGAVTLTANGVLLGNGTGVVTAVAPATAGLCLLSNGTGSAPSYQSCAAGAGSAGGANTQVQFNNATALGGSANLTWVTPALTIGVNASATGQLVLANGGGSGQSVTVQNPSTTSAYNFNLPTAAGTSGHPLLSGGGGSTAMTFGILGLTGGGTGASITATSGGIPYFSSSSAMASSAALAANAVVLGGGAGTTPATTANATMSAGALTLGQVGSVGGSTVLSGATSGTATIRVAAAAGTATIFQLPANNGTSTFVLQTDGAGATSWVAAVGGGTVTSVASGACMTGGPVTTTGTLAFTPNCQANYLSGLTMSTGTDATNDINIAAGVANDSTNVLVMVIATALGKQTDVDWAVGGTTGTPLGCRDAALSATATVHFFVIARVDTGVVDALCSNSATAPTLPTNYTLFRRIGGVPRVTSALLGFSQIGDDFWLNIPRQDVNTGTLSTTSTAYPLITPLGVVTNAYITVYGATTSSASAIWVRALTMTDAAVTAAGNANFRDPTAGFGNIANLMIPTDTSSQIAARASAAITTFIINTRGWNDKRGR